MKLLSIFLILFSSNVFAESYCNEPGIFAAIETKAALKACNTDLSLKSFDKLIDKLDNITYTTRYNNEVVNAMVEIQKTLYSGKPGSYGNYPEENACIRKVIYSTKTGGFVRLQAKVMQTLVECN